MPGRDDAVGKRGVARDLAVLTGGEFGRRHLVGGRERLGGLAVVPAGLQRQHVGLGDLGLAGELLTDEGLAGLELATVHPRQQPEREHVLGALAVLLAGADRFDRAERQGGHRDGVHDVVGQLVGLQRVGVVADLGEVALGELVGVGDDQATARQIRHIGLERGGVHRDEHVGPVACREDVVVGDLDLERRDTGQRALRCSDLGRIVRLGRQVVAEQRGLGGEPVTGQLHAVAGVPGEADDHLLELLPRRAPVPLPLSPTAPAFHAFFGRSPASPGTLPCAAVCDFSPGSDPPNFDVTTSTDYCIALRLDLTARPHDTRAQHTGIPSSLTCWSRVRDKTVVFVTVRECHSLRNRATHR